MKKNPSPHPSPLEAHLGYWMRFVSNQVSAWFQQAVEASGVSVTDWVALRTLLDADDGDNPATHATLTQALGMTKGAVSKVVARLEDKGLVARADALQDARSHTLSLTPAGRALVPVLAAKADANDEQFFGHLPAAERQRLARLLQEMVRLHQWQEVPRS